MTTTSEQQLAIADAVAKRGYTDGYDDDQLLARQIVKLLEELCETAQCIVTSDPAMQSLLYTMDLLGSRARRIFDNRERFMDVRVDRVHLEMELPDLVVPLAVMAYLIDVDDMMEIATIKAETDIDRGIRYA